jgi:hypothetical protein
LKHLAASCSLTIALFGSACVTHDDVSSTEQEIKGKNRMFATQRSLNQVAVYDQGGELLGAMSGPGLSVAFGVIVAGDDIFVVSQANNAVFAHLHEHGETHEARWALDELVPGATSGLSVPFYPNVKDGVLYVSSQNSNTYGEVLRYDAKTGEALGAFAPAGSGGVDGPRGIDWDSAGNFYVAGFRSNNVVKFDAVTGEATAFASVAGACGLAINPANQICVGSAAGTGVHCFDADGSRIYGDRATTNHVVCGLDWGRDGRVYATQPPLGRVDAHDIAAGTVETFATIPMVADVSWGTH